MGVVLIIVNIYWTRHCVLSLLWAPFYLILTTALPSGNLFPPFHRQGNWGFQRFRNLSVVKWALGELSVFPSKIPSFIFMIDWAFLGNCFLKIGCVWDAKEPTSNTLVSLLLEGKGDAEKDKTPYTCWRGGIHRMTNDLKWLNAASWKQSRSPWSWASLSCLVKVNLQIKPSDYLCLSLMVALAILKPPFLRYVRSGGFGIIGPIFPVPPFLLYFNSFARKAQIKRGRYSWTRPLSQELEASPKCGNPEGQCGSRQCIQLDLDPSWRCLSELAVRSRELCLTPTVW